MSIADFFAFCAASAGTILGTTAFASGIMAAVLLWLHRRTLSDDDWLEYIGYGFSVFAIQYLLTWLVRIGWRFSNAGGDLASLTAPIQAVGSLANNVCFLLAALRLLEIRWPHERRVIIVAAIIDLGLVWGFSSTPWARFPDKAPSFVCLLLLAAALYLNTRDMGSPRVARLLLACTSLYAAANLAYASVPMIAAAPGVSFNAELAQSLNRVPEQWRESITLADAYDAGLYALALVLKVALFSSALLLVMRYLVLMRPGTYHQMLRAVAAGRTEFLSVEGIVRTIGENVGADLSEVCMRVPSLSEPRVVWWRWLRSPDNTNRKSQETTELPGPTTSIVGSVLAGESRIWSPDHTRDPNVRYRYLPNALNMRALVTVPIHYHNSIIGALNLEWQSARRFRPMLLERISDLADFLAPVIQGGRQLGALDRFGKLLPALEHSADSETGERVLRRARVVHECFAPAATAIAVEIGFRALWAACSDRDATTDTMLPANAPSGLEQVCREAHRLGAAAGLGPLSTVPIELTIRRADSQQGRKETRIGSLVLAIPDPSAGGFDPSRAPLGANDLHRRTAGRLIADALVDSSRVELSTAMGALQVALQSQDLTSPADWQAKVNEGVRQVGLAWAVARGAGSERLLGPQDAKAAVETLLANGDPAALGRRPVVWPLASGPVGRATRVISLPLPAAGAMLWLGVEREAFGPELEWSSPWKTYLDQLQDASEAALLRIVSTMEFQRLLLENARAQGLSTSLVTMGTMTHQLANFARVFSDNVDVLDSAVKTGRLRAEERDRETIGVMKASTEELAKILAPLTTLSVVSEENPCDLRKVIERTHQLHRVALEQRGINYTCRLPDVQASLAIAVPFHVATLALANLVSNAIDAGHEGGAIHIEALELGNVLLCHVEDDGKGLADVVRADPFALGVTTRDGSGGWGLYLTKRSLREFLAEVVVAKPGPGGTVFTITFPRAS